MKTTFVLRTNYDDLFQELSPAQAGEVIQGVFALVNGRQIPSFTSDASRILFKCIQKDIVFDLEKYAQLCAKRSASGRKGGKSKKSKCLPSKNLVNPSKPKQDEEMSRDEMSRDDISLTAPANAAQTESDFCETSSKQPALKNALQQFSNHVLANFEPEVKTDAQKGIWFKRNCRCLSDILKFCEGNIPLALQTIHVCLERLEKAGLSGGYEAVCRNLPEYYAKAQTQMEDSPYGRLNA